MRDRLFEMALEVETAIGSTDHPADGLDVESIDERLSDFRAVIDDWLAQYGEAVGPMPDAVAERIEAARALKAERGLLRGERESTRLRRLAAVAAVPDDDEDAAWLDADD
jgi:hypothetical protein